MTTKKIVKEFTFKKNSNYASGVVPRTLFGTWPSFLNTYGVWPNYGNGVENHILNFTWTPVKGGVYTFTATCDNSFRWEISNARVYVGPLQQEYTRNGYALRSPFRPVGYWPGVLGGLAQPKEHFAQILSGNSWQTVYSTVPKTNYGGDSSSIAQFRSGQQLVTSEFLSNNGNMGPVQMRFHVRNDGGPAALAATITNSDGVVEWSTRDVYQNDATGRYVNGSFPFSCTMNVHGWGGGGGHGGTDNQSGGDGANGSYNTKSINIERGDNVEVIVGRGGTVGIGGIVPPIGRGGDSRINVGSDGIKSFSGGNGGQGILAGSGGGGGGASIILVNGEVQFVAGGGGGGGGAGIAWPIGGGNLHPGRRVPNWEGKIPTYDPWSDANPNDQASGASTDYRGANGQNGSYGGGGGGGGGGLPGGRGGRYLGGDTTAYPGQAGGNFPANSYSDGKNTQYYKKGFGRGGGYDGAGQSGENGRIVIEMIPTSLISVKDSGEWKQISAAHTKVGGTWKDIDTVYVKVDGKWRRAEGSGLGADDVTIDPTTIDYGRIARAYGS
jgi:hypothetical protein